MAARALLAAVAAAVTAVAVAAGSHAACVDRATSCSGHGDCSSSSAAGAPRRCVCDRFYEGHRCDVWRSSFAGDMKGLQWVNCTHARTPGAADSLSLAAPMQLCSMNNKSICEAAGAPTVPPPNFTGVCYQAPQMPLPGAQIPSVCSDYRGVGVVIHGVKGVFCARPCATEDALSCDTCPCHPENGNPCPCKIMNKTDPTQCLYCSGECKAEHGNPQPRIPSSAPCSPGGKISMPATWVVHL